MNVLRLQAEYDMNELLLSDPETPAHVRAQAMRRAGQLRKPLKEATDADISNLMEATLDHLLGR